MASAWLSVQGASTRAESVRAAYAEAAWREGTAAFITNSVPFSYSSGPLLAKSTASVVRDLASRIEGELRILELGAGIGYLSRHVLQRLKEKSPEIYSRCRFIVTDGSPDVVEQVKRRGIFRGVDDSVAVEVVDVQSPEEILNRRPHLVLMSYLLDSIPPEHTLNGEPVRFVTNVHADAVLWDTTEWPPRFLSGHALAEALRSPAAFSPATVRRAAAQLVEVPQVGRGDGLRNRRADPLDRLLTVLHSLDDQAMLLITDFGYAEQAAYAQFSQLTTEYGACAFWAVFFDEIAECAERAGFATYLHSGPEGGTHSMAVVRRPGDASEATFRRAFDGVVSDRPASVLYALEDDAGIQEVYDAVTKIEQTMAAEEVESYGNLSRFVHLLLPFRLRGLAERHARRCIELYGEMAAPEAAILGSLMGQRGELDEAAAWFDKAVQIAPNYAHAYHGMAGVYRARKDWAGYAQAMRRFIETTDEEIFTPALKMVQTLEAESRGDLARETRRWLSDAANETPWIIPESIRGQL